MKLFGFLRKPGWEHKDAAVRLRAVQEGSEPGLEAVLAELAQRDPDAEVRRAALKRVDDPVLLARRMRGDPDPRVAALARERLVARLCAGDLPFEQARAVLLDMPDAEVLAEVAVRAADAALRRAALEHISRPGLLYERCLNDPDPAIRHWLLQRIDAPDALERVAAAARRRDKALSRAARERMEALLLASGDPAALARRALELCERASRLSRELPEDREGQLAALRQDWQAIATRVSAALQTRTEGALDMAAAAIAASRAPVPAPAPERPVEPVAGPAVAAPAADGLVPGTQQDAGADAPDASAGPARAAADSATQDDGADASPAVAPTAADAAQAARREDQRLARERAAEALAALERALADDNVGEARAARELLQPDALDAGKRRRLARAEERLRKLEQWQRWASHDVRRRLCDEVAGLHGSGLHPDALATRLKELQAEWARLDALEGDAAPPTDSGIARRFRALCHRAIRPARGYFEKRREVREQHAGQVDALIAEVDAALESGAGGPALATLRRQVAEALRALDAVAPEKRGAQGRALRGLLQRLDDAAGQAREQAALDKRRLLARLRRDLGTADAEAALALARQAQADWKRLARAGRETDDTLWAELRGLVDPLFEGAQAREQERRQRDAEAMAAAEAVLQELSALAEADAQRLAHAEAHLESLQARWRALQPAAAEEAPAPRDRDARPGQRGRRGNDRERDRGRPARRPQHPLEDRFGALVARVQQARARAASSRARDELEAIAAAGALLDGYAAADAGQRQRLQDELASLQLAADAREAIEGRRAALEAGTADTAGEEAPEVLAVRADLIAGLPSPAGVETLRRREQMQRLAQRLEGAEQRPPRVQLRALLLELSAMGVAPGRRAELSGRILRGWEAVEG